LWSRLTRDLDPEAAERELTATRNAMLVKMDEFDKLSLASAPDIADLAMDALALRIYLAATPDERDAILLDSRLRTLLAGQQTAQMLTQTCDNARKVSGQHLLTIDKLLSITIPNWKMVK
jgi:hypothetical protein